MTAVFCTNAVDRKARTWAECLEPFDRLELVVSDAAKGIAGAVAAKAAARHAAPNAPALEHGLGVFHTAMEANRVPARSWRRAETAWEHAEAAAARAAATPRRGVDARGVAGAARSAWGRATAAFEEAERLDTAWRRAHAALDLFTPDGRLNDRCHAEAEIAAASKGLTGPGWARLRNALEDRRGLAFLDRMQRRLESAEPRPRWREAMAWRWWLRRRRRPSGDRVTDLIRATARDRVLTEAERTSYHRVAAVLNDTVRAGSAVECMNSVLRMQPPRHRRMAQSMLDLKRLYWNCRPSRSGPRQQTSPYQTPGLDLPSFDFWTLLQTDPRQLTQRRSTAHDVE